MGNPTIQRLYSDRERVIVYEPLYREPFVEGMKSRIRIVKASSGPYSRPTWKSIRRGEHLGS